MTETPSRWTRFARYPLVALVGAVAAYILSLSAVRIFLDVAGPPDGTTAFSVTSRLLGIAALLLAYKLVIARIGERPRDDLAVPGALGATGAGLGVGFLLFSAIVAVAALLGVYRLVGPGDASGLPMALLAAGLFPAISEEILFRGILFRWLEEWGGSLLALLVTSALFGAAHLANPNASPIAAIGIALEAGVLLGAAYMLTRSLWFPVGLHAGWNLTQGAIFDVPVSGNDARGLLDARLVGDPLLTGGGFGLEASIIAIVIATLFGLVLLNRAIARGELIRPRWVRRRLAARAALGSAAVGR